MGEMAQLLQEQEEMEYYKMLDSIKKQYGEGLWTIKTGETIKIKDMSRNHILNTILFIKRNRSFLDFFIEDIELRDKKIRELETELIRRSIYERQKQNQTVS